MPLPGKDYGEIRNMKMTRSYPRWHFEKRCIHQAACASAAMTTVVEFCEVQVDGTDRPIQAASKSRIEDSRVIREQ